MNEKSNGSLLFPPESISSLISSADRYCFSYVAKNCLKYGNSAAKNPAYLSCVRLCRWKSSVLDWNTIKSTAPTTSLSASSPLEPCRRARIQPTILTMYTVCEETRSFLLSLHHRAGKQEHFIHFLFVDIGDCAHCAHSCEIHVKYGAYPYSCQSFSHPHRSNSLARCIFNTFPFGTFCVWNDVFRIVVFPWWLPLPSSFLVVVAAAADVASLLYSLVLFSSWYMCSIQACTIVFL